MRQSVKEILATMGDQLIKPTQAQIDRAEAVAIYALRKGEPPPLPGVNGGSVCIAMLAILLNKQFILEGVSERLSYGWADE